MSAASRLFLLRHGQTEWNVERRLQGHMDSALTETGRRQALENGEKLSRLVKREYRIVSSPLGRCRETSEIVASTLGYARSDIEYDDRLKELSFGSWEGRTLSDIQLDEPEIYKLRNENRWDVPAPDGESYAMVAKRLQSWMFEPCGAQTLVVVSHGCAGRILRGLFAKLTPSSIYTLEEPHDAIYQLAHHCVTRVA